MTTEQQNFVFNLRKNGMGYGTIAKTTGISVNTIKSFCKRNSSLIKGEDVPEGEKAGYCHNCGITVIQTKGRKEKRFCSDKCRHAWWNSHLDQVKRKTFTKTICHNCGKEFTTYGKAERKYCSHQCYINHRFGDVSDD